jgi:hypothetical protein
MLVYNEHTLKFILKMSADIIKFLCSSEEKYKGNANPVQAWTGPEVSRGLRLPDFKTISI